MRRRLENEVEERRVIRLLAELAAEVPSLPDDQLYSFPAAAPLRRPRRLQTAARYLPAAAAAAVLAIGVSVQLDGSTSRPSAVHSANSKLVTFPEGTALQLLIAAEPR